MSTNLDEAVYHMYDAAVAKTLYELMNRSPYHDTIRLMGFDRKNKEHLFVLRIALMARDLCQVPVEVSGNWRDRVVINWNIRKGFKRIKVVSPSAPNGLWTPFLIAKVKHEAECPCLGAIYDAYYEGSCG